MFRTWPAGMHRNPTAALLQPSSATLEVDGRNAVPPVVAELMAFWIFDGRCQGPAKAGMENSGALASVASSGIRVAGLSSG